MNKRRHAVSVLVFTAFLVLTVSTATATDVMVSQEVEDRMETSDEPVEVLVTLEDQSVVTVTQDVRRSQRPLLSYANSTDGVSVLNEFWIANAVLLELEPEVGYKKIADIDGVQSVRSNTEIEVLDSVSVSSRSYSSQSYSPGANPSVSSGVIGQSQGYPAVENFGNEKATTATQSTPYGVEQINAPDVWSQQGTKGEGVNVAVLDTGVNVSHPDIDLRTTDSGDPTYPGGWAEFDGQGNRVQSSEPHDSDGHGTHVSGTVAGENTGVAPGANLMHAMVVNGDTGTVSQALSGMEWAVENDADVVTMSLGGGTEDVWIEAVENANEMGVVVIAASGNDGSGTSTSPGNVYDSVSVGAVDSSVDVASFSGGEIINTDSTWGSSAPDDWPSEYVVPDTVAAGVGVNSTSTGGGYTFLSGTSMATPHVAGAAALALSASGDQSPDEVRRAFALTAFGSGSEEPDTRYGHGAADALAASEFLMDGASVSGTVVDGSGAPVEEAELTVDGFHLDTKNGDYAVELAERSWEFDATAPGYEDTTETVSLTQNENVRNDIVLEEIEPASFEVSGLDGPSGMETGETSTVTATVTNTGDKKGRQDLKLRLANEGESLDDSDVVGTRNDLTLGAGESKTVGFRLDAPKSEGRYEYGVFSDDDSKTAELTVEKTPEPAFYSLSNLDPEDTTVVQGDDPIDVSVVVKNVGDESGDQTLTLTVFDDRAQEAFGAKKNVEIDGGGSETVTFEEVPAGNLEPGKYDHTVSSDDDTVQGDLTVVEPTEPATFEVRNPRVPETVKQGEEFHLRADVENTGDVEGTQDVEVRLDESGEPLTEDTVVKVRTETLAGGGETTVGFENLSIDASGEYDYTVLTEDDEVRGTLTVEDKRLFTEPLLNSFDAPPRNIPTSEGGLDDNLYEDLDGDGELTDLDPVVTLFGVKIRGNGPDLTTEQARALNWDENSPRDEVTVADLVALFGRQIRSN